MSIFKKREPGELEQAGAEAKPEAGAEAAHTAKPEQPTGKTPGASFTPPFVRPGVVPPPASPVYSMRAPEPAAASVPEAAPPKAQPVHSVAAQRPPAAPSHALQRATPASPRPRVTPVNFRPPRARQHFDPVAATQAGLLNLAWRWQEAGSPIRAIHAYLQILIRYPGSPGADAAVADLVELSEKLAHTGQFHIALGIYDHLEELLAC